MQGFPVGGGRIRLSWGRSQCSSLTLSLPSASFFVAEFSVFPADKAAQAAAHAAHLGLGGLPPVNELDLNGLNPSQQAQLAVALQAVGGLNGSAAANANLLRQLALVNAAPGYPARGNAGAGLGGLNGLGGGGLGAAGFGGLGAGAGAGLGEGGLGNLSGLNPQMLQLMAMNLNGLGGGEFDAAAARPITVALELTVSRLPLARFFGRWSFQPCPPRSPRWKRRTRRRLRSQRPPYPAGRPPRPQLPSLIQPHRTGHLRSLFSGPVPPS